MTAVADPERDVMQGWVERVQTISLCLSRVQERINVTAVAHAEEVLHRV